MRRCITIIIFPVAISLFAKSYYVGKNNFSQPAKIPMPVKETADYTTTDGIQIPIGCQIYWFDALKGDTIGCTRYDRQWNMSPQRRIVFDPNTGCTHALWMHSVDAVNTFPNRHMFYNCKTEGVWVFGQNINGGTPVQEVSKDGYGALDVDTAGLAVVGLHRVIGTNPRVAVYIDQIQPGLGAFKKLVDLPVASGDNLTQWPAVAVNGNNDMVVVAHADSTVGQSHDHDKCWYSYSKDGGSSWSNWTTVDTFTGLAYNIFASKKSQKICITWGKSFQEAGCWNGHMMYMESEDGGTNWGPHTDAFSSIPTPSNKTYDFSTMKNCIGNVYGIYDSDDNLHLVTDASLGTTSKGSYFPALSCVIWHYSESEGINIVATHPYPYKLAWSSTDWRFLYPYQGQIMAKPVIAEDPNNKWLYVTWVEFPYDTVGSAGYEAGEIYITYSMDGGKTWAPKLNLTMTPAGCEVFATMAPIVNDTVRIFYEYDNSGYDGIVRSPAESDTFNPMMYLEVPVTGGDVGVVDITSPTADTIIDGSKCILPNSGTTYFPKVLYKNYGTSPVSFQTRFEMLYNTYYKMNDTLNADTLFTPTIVYYDIQNVTELAPNGTTTVNFKPWTSKLGLPKDTLFVSLRAYVTFLADTNLSNNDYYSSTQPYLTVISPNGGENWLGGSTHPITWTKIGTGFASYRLLFSTNGDNSYPDTIAKNVSLDSMRWSWLLPTINCTTCRVKLQALDSLNNAISEDVSDNNFTIDSDNPSAFDLSFPTNNSWTKDSLITFGWNTATDSTSGIGKYQFWMNDTLRRDSIPTDTTTCKLVLKDGNYSWFVRAYDKAGNFRNSDATWILNIDRSCPYSFSLISPVDSEYVKSDSMPAFVWHKTIDTGIGQVKYQLWLDNSLDTGGLTDTVVLLPIPPSTGLHRWFVKAYDSLGNWRKSTETRAVIIDSLFDTIAPASPESLFANSSNPSPWTKDSIFTIRYVESGSLTKGNSWGQSSNVRHPEPHPILSSSKDDISGIALALYKLGTAPTSNYDTTGSVSINPFNLIYKIEGCATLWVWLKDKKDNLNHNNRASVILRYDTTSPLIDSTTVLQDTVKFWGPFEVRTKITDTAPLRNPILFYRTSTDTEWVPDTMSSLGANWFIDSIPELSHDSLVVDYYLTGEDSATNISRTPGSGFYSFVTHSNDIGIEDKIPDKFVLFSPTPNPSMSNIAIKYGLPEKASVQLNLYDISGRLVKTLCSGTQERGYFTVNITDNELAKGIYFLKLSAGTFKATRKLTILR